MNGQCGLLVPLFGGSPKVHSPSQQGAPRSSTYLLTYRVVVWCGVVCVGLQHAQGGIIAVTR